MSAVIVQIEGVGPVYATWTTIDGDPGRYFHWYDPEDGYVHHGAKKSHDQVPPGCVEFTMGVPTPVEVARAEEIPELHREGRRTIRPGQQVSCQPNQRPRTRKVMGEVVKVYDDGAVMVAFADDVVTMDQQWVHVPIQGRLHPVR